MQIERIAIRNFRSLRDVALDVEPLTALVGENGSGKSAVLRALAFFFNEPGVDLDDEDCWGGSRELTIEVSVTFGSPPNDLREQLGPRLDEHGRLVLTKRSEPGDGRRQTQYVSRARRVPGFQPIREKSPNEKSPNKMKARAAYNELRKEAPFTDLPTVTSHEKMLEALAAWEADHPDHLEEVEDWSVTVGSGGELDIGRWFSVAVIPAVHDATQEAAEGRGSLFPRLVERLVRPETRFGDALGQLDRDVRQRYEELVDQGQDALRRAEQALSQRVSVYAPGSAVKLGWEPQPPTLRSPTVFAQLVEAGFAAEIGRQGHGVQRSYLLALLQELATPPREGTDEEPEDQPLLVVLIEEPELYQHPTRARLFSRVLDELVEGSSEQAQVIFATHSPFFVSLKRAQAIRLLQRAEGSNPPETLVRQVDLDAAAVRLWQASGGPGDPFTAESLRVHLRLLMDTPLSEGFFSRVAVLVEGDADRAMLAAAAEARGVGVHELGIAILPVGGKGNLDKPLLIFGGLQIRTYVVFDGDAGKGGESDTVSNVRLLRLLGEPDSERPPTTVNDIWACFEHDMVATTRTEVGEDTFDAARRAACEDLGVPESKKKDPLVLGVTVEKLFAQGSPPETLSKIVEHTRALA